MQKNFLMRLTCASTAGIRREPPVTGHIGHTTQAGWSQAGQASYYCSQWLERDYQYKQCFA